MTLKQYIYLIIFLVVGNFTLQAQDTITVNSVITGKMEVTARKRVVLEDGFKALKGCYFVASTDSTLEESAEIVSPTRTVTEDETIPVSTVSDDENYIRIITFFKAISTDSVTDAQLDTIKHAESIQYFDGLGRLCETKQVAASPDGFDIVTPTVYDDYGREAQQYLPYVSDLSDGSYEDSTASACETFYGQSNLEGRTTDSNPYATTEFDNSPLNRVVGQYGAGADWYSNEKETKTDYTTNTSPITLWDEDGDDVPYEEGTLYVTRVTDENGTNTTSEYKDKQGQVVMKVSSGDGDSLRTAYVYDDFGLLRTVVSPLASSPSDSASCYYYTYDKRHRMITKKIPGAKEVYMAYDNRDRLVITQDGKMRKENSKAYLFTKYDQLNRPIMTGTVEISGGISSVRSALESYSDTMYESTSSKNYGYTLNNSYPKSIVKDSILTVTWYDDHSFLGLSCAEKCTFDNYSDLDETFDTDTSSMTKGLVTGSMVKVLTLSDTTVYKEKNTDLVTANYYDEYGNVIRTVSSNFKGGYDITLSNYEPITYRVKNTCEVHKSSSSDTGPLIIAKAYTYDHMGRLLQTTCKINDEDEIVLNAMKYNELGELVAKYLHSTEVDSSSQDFIQKLDYDYNIRGWLTAINDPSLNEDNDVFGLKLYYDDGADVSADAQYNGNISAMTWAVDTAVIQGYSYTYDAFNRLTAAEYGEGEDLSSNTGLNDVTIPSYDANGNIQTLYRYYKDSAIDSLFYTYMDKSNQLETVIDSANSYMNIRDFENGNSDEYAYDANGNMTYDPPKDNNIFYNILNLPKQVNYNGDHGYRAFYLYDAAGTKLAKIIKDEDNADLHLTEYLGSLEYTDSIISSIQTEEGRALPPDSSFTDWHYQYYLKDHLGNVRGILTTTQAENTGSVELAQKCSYYPFGMVLNKNDYSSSYNQNKYLYNGKEYQDDDLDGESLNCYDYGARFYDPALGRWNSIDLLAEFYFSSTPYHYTLNNPVAFTDEYGMAVTRINGGYRITGDDIGVYFNNLSMLNNDNLNNFYESLNAAADNPNGNAFANTTDGVNVTPNGANLNYNRENGKSYVHDNNARSKYNDELRAKDDLAMQQSVSRAIGENGTKVVMGMSNVISVGMGVGSLVSAGTKGMLWLAAKRSSSRVFWSGGKVAMNAAADYAKANGMTTLEMTRAGKNLTTLTKGMQWSEAGPMWQRMSAAYANGARGTIHVFQNARGVGMESVWKSVEYPILQQKGIKIIYHIVH